MSLAGIFKKKEPLLSVDIGSTSIKCVELDLRSSTPELSNVAIAPLTADVFSSFTISNPQKVADQIKEILDKNSISDKRVVTAMAAPAVFTKKVALTSMKNSDLKAYMEMEAANIVPHSIDAVRMDYHVLGEDENGQMEVLVVAVKNDVVDSYLETFDLCGLQVAVVDVDYFALQNMFEHNYPDFIERTTALINIGARYSSINICRDGISLFSGDITLAGKNLTDSLMEQSGLTFEDAEKVKKKVDLNNPEFAEVSKIFTESVTNLAVEFNKQLSLFWNATGSDGAIEKIFITGGASQAPALDKEIAGKTGIECEVLDPLKNIECGDGFEKDYLKSISPFIGIAVGMGMRQPGDKEF